MALFSKRPFIGRRVSDECIDCGLCQKSCPMAAIPENPLATRHEECIVCGACEKVCPVDAICFTWKKGEKIAEQPGFSADRRRFIVSGLAGTGTAALLLTGLSSVYGTPGEGRVAPPWLLRPPGALPEAEFLAECVRCGECMTACPTNTLQPIWFQAGIMGLFSPAVTPRRGACDPECVRCGQVCPTNAIRELPPEERMWAKLGTAVVLRQECLAWEHQKKCLVCDEVCPFDAVELRSEPDNPVGVPHVLENKCSGCGLCEYHCPIQNRAAIIIKPVGEIRLEHGSYREKAKQQDIKLRFKNKVVDASAYPADDFKKGFAPGFTD
jgi:MauM/NapG family ferredoxin protein